MTFFQPPPLPERQGRDGAFPHRPHPPRPIPKGLRFRPDLGQSGGEDTEFCYRLGQSGARMMICDTAEVTEPAPLHRLRAGWLTERRLTERRLAEGRQYATSSGRGRVALAATALAKMALCLSVALPLALHPPTAARWELRDCQRSIAQGIIDHGHPHPQPVTGKRRLHGFQQNRLRPKGGNQDRDIGHGTRGIWLGQGHAAFAAFGGKRLRVRSGIAVIFLLERWTSTFGDHKAEMAVLSRFDHAFVLNGSALEPMRRRNADTIRRYVTEYGYANADSTADLAANRIEIIRSARER